MPPVDPHYNQSASVVKENREASSDFFDNSVLTLSAIVLVLAIVEFVAVLVLIGVSS